MNFDTFKLGTEIIKIKCKVYKNTNLSCNQILWQSLLKKDLLVVAFQKATTNLALDILPNT
jgi:hypothetical protein